MIIEPRVLKGFRDFLPDQASRRIAIMHTLEQVFLGYGFVPIDTPVLEYREVLLGKGGGETDKQVYAFTDQGGREVAMRFDLTVPFARFMASHINELSLPFKRYHIDKVWRGENTQKGRYREFVQCDFDIVGIDALSADLEILLMMRSAFTALGIDNVSFKVNHRGLFNRFLDTIEVASHSAAILRIVDKLAKIGEKEVREQLASEIGSQTAEKVLDYIQAKGSFLEAVEKLEELAGGSCEESNRLREIYRALEEASVADSFILDPSITRGLDYYTGIVYETFLNDLPQIGSVCSGGRYNNLASLYTKQQLPGVGSSIGLDRLVAALEELGKAGGSTSAPAVAIFNIDESLSGYYHMLAGKVRKAGLSCEVQLQSQKLGKQFAWAEKRGIRMALICGGDEKNAGKVSVKNLATRESRNMIDIKEAIDWCRMVATEE
ncbi:histidine--tRNA ligase [Sediminispirochaeta smaragdinae]|uniref:Histidine--tRNA ligase n=1 Tax=Sediminispirochaeta smaragdinae (strain DSM 11293 / JCM 15392 / SEBR 4228) TaxID=573413 RepID=E1R6L2_SEDSS|nr:histidine--tRNA ligase [Sediminispirochaeta smaragdinae]ADK81030.1 histidyl-tRNA synthetase [Sediminispirochaeta smaragdinae DSM 11293]